MKRRRKIKSIPKKKIKKRVKEEYDIDEYIENHLKKYATTFEKQARKEYDLLDKLIDSFAEFIDTEKELPFIYSYHLIYNIYNLTLLEQQAVNNFKDQIAEKGYTCEYKIKNMDPGDYHPWMRLIITVQ